MSRRRDICFRVLKNALYLLALAALFLPAVAATAQTGADVAIERGVAMKTRDGVTLRADVYLPAGEGTFPVLLTRTPYDKTHGAAFGEMGALRGYMVVVPTYTVSPASIAFAAQTRNTTSAAQTVTIANTGTVPLPFTNIALGGANAGSFAQTNTCAAAGLRPFPNSLAAGTSCTVSVTFRPTAVRSYSASLNISVGGAATPAQTAVALTGSGQ